MRWDIHCSASILFTLISSTLTVRDCRYFCMLPISNENKINPMMEIRMAKRISPTKLLVFRFCPRELKFLSPHQKQ
nr:hypothetical protein TorRG33x02_024580 [Ipomoea batatas]